MRTTARRGALLPMVLVIMVLIALSASAALFTARQERRASWNVRLATDALGGVDQTLAAARDELANIAPTLGVGTSVTATKRTGDDLVVTTRFTRLGPSLFLASADAGAETAQGWLARRTASLLLRLDPPNLGFPAALHVVGESSPESSLTDGSDRAPPAWPCERPPRTDTASTRHPSPAPDSALIASLRDRAALTLPAGTALGGVHPVVRDDRCLTDRADNWGDPDRGGACASWLPIIHAAGDLTVDGGAGQGLLLVDGNLVIGGGFRFVGAVVVHGEIDVGAGGASLVGGVIANRLTVAAGSGNPGPVVLRSSCAVTAALLAAGTLVPVVDRAWRAGR